MIPPFVTRQSVEILNSVQNDTMPILQSRQNRSPGKGDDWILLGMADDFPVTAADRVFSDFRKRSYP
jgi:hypothetical protein